MTITKITRITARDRHAAQRAVILGLYQRLPNGAIGHLYCTEISLTGEDWDEAGRIDDYRRGRWDEVTAAAREVLDARFV